LTNYSINKNSPYFFASDNGEEANTGFKRSIKFLKNYLKENNIEFENIWVEIKNIIRKTIYSIQPIL
jgi:tubulin polyglutamylase TTLL6/13